MKSKNRGAQARARRGAQSLLLFVVGAITLAFGVYMSVSSNLISAFDKGLNGKTENALILDIVGIICLLAGWGLRHSDG